MSKKPIKKLYRKLILSFRMPSATGQDWEKYKKFADDEIEEKKITPLTDEYVKSITRLRSCLLIFQTTEIFKY